MHSKTWMRVIALLAVFALVLAACGDSTEDTQADDTTAATSAPDTPETTMAPDTPDTTMAPDTPDTTAAPMIDYKACEVTDTGGVDDRSFNQSAWEGALKAEADLGVEVKVLESQSAADFDPNINSLIADDCDLVITIGFLLGDATLAAATANPDVSFSIIDYAYGPANPGNIVSHVYATNEGAFLAGYVAAGMTQTGTIATYGGVDIGGPVTDFMDGFVWGARYYNQQKGTDVQVLGWNPDTKEGLFTGNFESIEDARTLSVSLADEGADIFLGVGGQISQGSAALAQERGDMWVIGVDSDWFLSVPQFSDVVLTSVLKKIDVSVYDTIALGVDGAIEGGMVVNTMASGGIDIAPFHDADSSVPADLKAELEQIKAAIIDGSLDIVISG